MSHSSLKTLITLIGLIVGGLLLTGPTRAGTLAFSAPERLASLPWATDSKPGVPLGGAEWLVVDNRDRYWLEADLDFGLYSPGGHYLQTISPLDKRMNFYGFAAMEALPDGRIVLLQRLETQAEQRQKLNYENRSKPGARLVVLNPEGGVETDRVEVDPLQPHSDYTLEGGEVYSIHDDGTYEMLDSVGAPSKDEAFGKFAAVDDSRHWNDYVRTLPVFRSASRFYHDAQGNVHADKDSKFFLMGRPFIEGTAPLAERNGKIYYQVVCYPHGDFTDSVFVEDSVRKNYALIDLVPAEKNLETTHDHALFVDKKGNLYEGVAEKEGYRIYEWKILN